MDAVSASSLGGVIDAMGRADFAERALEALQGAVQAASWSVYTLAPGRVPVLHGSATRREAGPDRTTACFAAYASGLYLRDSSFDRIRRTRSDGPLVTTMAADSAPNREHRDAIYRAHQLRERLSVAALDGSGTLLAVNVYRHEPQGPFSDAERARFAALAPLLHQAVRRHVAWAGEPPAPADVAALPRGLPAAAAGARAALLAAAPTLTARELDVCERLLRGWTHDGVAADLGLSVATVKTYRTRAFGRLGLHFRSELFARFGGGAGNLLNRRAEPRH